jgi:hypothetical protein
LNLQTRSRQEKPIESEKWGFTNFLTNTFIEIFPSDTKFVEVDKEETIFFFSVDFTLVLIVLDLELEERSAVLRQLFVEEFGLTVLFAETFFPAFNGRYISIIAYN